MLISGRVEAYLHKVWEVIKEVDVVMKESPWEAEKLC